VSPVKESASPKVAASKPASRPRRRSSTKKVPPAEGAATARRESTQLVQQLAVLTLAILLGLIGLAVHFLWIPAIVLMSILFGLIASGLRAERGGGVIAEVAATVMVEAKSVAEGIAERGADGTKEQVSAGSSRS
jgi:hypothetical protein